MEGVSWQDFSFRYCALRKTQDAAKYIICSLHERIGTCLDHRLMGAQKDGPWLTTILPCPGPLALRLREDLVKLQLCGLSSNGDDCQPFMAVLGGINGSPRRMVSNFMRNGFKRPCDSAGASSSCLRTLNLDNEIRFFVLAQLSGTAGREWFSHDIGCFQRVSFSGTLRVAYHLLTRRCALWCAAPHLRILLPC